MRARNASDDEVAPMMTAANQAYEDAMRDSDNDEEECTTTTTSPHARQRKRPRKDFTTSDVHHRDSQDLTHSHQPIRALVHVQQQQRSVSSTSWKSESGMLALIQSVIINVNNDRKTMLTEALGISGYNPMIPGCEYAVETANVVKEFIDTLFNCMFMNGATFSSRLEFIFKLFIDSDIESSHTIDSEQLYQRATNLFHFGAMIEEMVIDSRFHVPNNPNYCIDVVTKSRRIRDQFYNGHMIVRAATPIAKIRAQDKSYKAEEDAFSFYPTLAIAGRNLLNEDKERPFNQLLLYCLDKFARRNFRISRAKGIYYSEHVHNSQKTNAWVPQGEILSFLNSENVIDVCINHRAWSQATIPKVRENIAEHIRTAHYSYIKEVERNMNVWSFTNGVYVGRGPNKKPYFVEYGQPLPPDVEKLPASAKFFNMEFPTKKTIMEHIITQEKIETGKDTVSHEFKRRVEDFVQRRIDDEERDWYNIPTPALDQILDTQEFPESVKRVFFMVLGRLFYPVDHLQFVPFLYGLGGTGKSTIVKLLKEIFCLQDIAELSSDAQKQFMTENFLERFIWLAPEVKHDFNLPQGVFQSLVVGETFEATVKGGKNKNIEFWGNGLMAGNEIPGYTGSGGAIRRRLLLFHFKKLVRRNDGTLFSRLRAEIANIIRKCNAAYLEFLAKYPQFEKERDLPHEFTQYSNDILNDINIVETMFNEERLIAGEGLYMPFTEFTKYIESVTRSMSKRMPVNGVDDAMCQQAFAVYNVRKERQIQSHEYPRHRVVGGGANEEPKNVADIFLMGVDVRERVSPAELNRHRVEQEQRSQLRNAREQRRLLETTSVAAERVSNPVEGYKIYDIYSAMFTSRTPASS